MAEDEKTVKFGLEQLKNPTPQWAQNVFRVVLLLTTAVAAWVAGTALIPENYKLEVMLVLKCIDPVIWGLSRFLGVEDKK